MDASTQAQAAGQVVVDPWRRLCFACRVPIAGEIFRCLGETLRVFVHANREPSECPSSRVSGLVADIEPNSFSACHGGSGRGRQVTRSSALQWSTARVRCSCHVQEDDRTARSASVAQCACSFAPQRNINVTSAPVRRVIIGQRVSSNLRLSAGWPLEACKHWLIRSQSATGIPAGGSLGRLPNTSRQLCPSGWQQQHHDSRGCSMGAGGRGEATCCADC